VPLTDRVERLESRVAIGELVASYFAHVDARRYDQLVALFTEDAVLEYPGGVAHGHEELLSFYESQLPTYQATYHYSHGHIVRFDDPGIARGFVDAHAEHEINGALVLAALRYDDTYRRGERWRFGSRALRMRYFLPIDRFASGYRHSAKFPPPPDWVDDL